MKTAILLHGTPDKEEYFSLEHPSPSNGHWLPWLQRALIHNHYLAQTPEMPLAYAPDYLSWKNVFERHEINNETILVGHSCGGGFLLRYLSENSVTPKRLVLVAPWLNPLKEHDKEVLNNPQDFFDFDIDTNLSKRIDTHLIYSDNDMESINVSIDIIKETLSDVRFHLFKNYGHFCESDMNGNAFPELLNICLKGKI